MCSSDLPEAERDTFSMLKELTTTYENSHPPITEAQHAALIVTIERKLIPDSQLRLDYFFYKASPIIPGETWEMAFIRLS